jgi:hypothetical protein
MPSPPFTFQKGLSPNHRNKNIEKVAEIFEANLTNSDPLPKENLPQVGLCQK